MPTSRVGGPAPTTARLGRELQRYSHAGERLLAGCVVAAATAWCEAVRAICWRPAHGAACAPGQFALSVLLWEVLAGWVRSGTRLYLLCVILSAWGCSGSRGGCAAACAAGQRAQESVQPSLALFTVNTPFAACGDVLVVRHCRQVHTCAGHVGRRGRRRDRGATDHQQRRQRACFSQGELRAPVHFLVHTVFQRAADPSQAGAGKLHVRRGVGRLMRRWRQQRRGRLWRRPVCEGRWRCAARRLG